MTRQALSEHQVTTFLAEALGQDVSDVAAIDHGEWSKAFSFRRDAADYIVRFSTTQADFLTDRLAMRYASSALLVPRVAKLGQAFGGFYAISNKAAGEFIDDLDQAGLRRLLPSLFSTLDAARRVDLSASHGFGGWGADGNREPTPDAGKPPLSHNPSRHRAPSRVPASCAAGREVPFRDRVANLLPCERRLQLPRLAFCASSTRG